ncbi:Peroxisomal adenine nucleotide transporter 1 [Zancudomyces culisetae]|uniref:Peroxisomal adenine nucleotide transporter 1 n=1 Tax=Zancudomyces culisetae TaxID=1213189 RepID=A0A1R1PLE6_ZANCU|nr:Peroxisomal adenine nucleotide transporter 1 [Zancudomyces culisetae]|eukprot:OMH81786.1 Peroxisomal adenine nucleotide transporter 1 [Zancudomyces culisetae]
MLCQCFTLPLNVIATRQQTSSSKSQESIVDVIREIIEIDGILGLWKGFKPTMVLCINPAITYGVFERTKTMLLERKSKNTDITSAYLLPSEAFAAGALSKTLATVVTYPYITAKTRLMWRPSKEEVEKFGEDVIYKDTTDVLKKTFKIAGVAGLYKVKF